MSEKFSVVNDLDFIPPLPDEELPPPLPESPPPPPLPLLTDEDAPPLPLDSPPSSPRPPSPLPVDASERPPLPDYSPPESPCAELSSRSPSPPVLECQEPFKLDENTYCSKYNLSPLSVRTDLDIPTVSPATFVSSPQSCAQSYSEAASPWQLAGSDSQSNMSDPSDNESIEDGEIVSLPDLDPNEYSHLSEIHNSDNDDEINPPLPDHPHPMNVEVPPPLPSSDEVEPPSHVVCPSTEITPGQVSDNHFDNSDPLRENSAKFCPLTSLKSGQKRNQDELLESEMHLSNLKRHRKEDEADDDAASSIAEPPPSIAGSLISQQSSIQEFHILDDIQSDDDDDLDADEEGEDGDSDSSLDYEEIDALLDSGVADPKPREPVQEGEEPVVKEKVILIEKGLNPFEILPQGWVVVTHNSGMPVYLHKDSRVCTLSRPYFLGPGSVRKHDIPISAIPCLQYKKEIEKEQKAVVEDKESQEVNAENGSAEVSSEIEKITSQVRIESALEKTQETSIDPSSVRVYCENLFQFKTINVHRFKTWKDRRRHQHKQRKTSRPMLPSDTKLITCPIIAPENESEEKPNRKKGFVLNPAGKSSIGILHEYMQHSMRLQPQYEFKELDNAQTPYSATVIINKMAYGVGYATSKKAAKAEAAKATLDILIPQLRDAAPEEDNADPFNIKHKDLSFFDELKIEDPRVADLCNRAGQPSPYQVLLECLKRNFVGDASLKMDMKTLKRQTGEFTMNVGSHSTTVTCKNKREGKQLAAQSILQLLHPHIQCWGSLLRLYGTDSHRALKQFQESITKLQSKERSNGPNLAILAKLKKEMLKLRERKAAIVPIGTMKIRSAELPSPTPVSIIKL